MREIVYDYASVPTIRDFHRSQAFIRGLMGPFGSGKSSGCVQELVDIAHSQPKGSDGLKKSRFAVIRNTYGELNDTTIKTFHDWVPPGIFGEWLKSEHTYIVSGFDGLHMEVMFRALDRPEHVAKLLSAEYTAAWVNEAREVPWTVIEALQGRVGRYPSIREGGCVRAGVIMDTNPPDTDSGWYRFFEEKHPKNAQIFKQPSGRGTDAENLPHLPRDYYTNLAEGKDPDFVTVYIDGKYGYVKDGKPVYPEYNDNLHCREVEPIRGAPIRRGWDFGLTPACTFSQIQPSGLWAVFDEITADSLGIDRFSDAVLTHCRINYADFRFEDFGDPAGAGRAQTDEKTCFEIMRGKGIDVQPGEIATTARIEAVKKPLNSMNLGQPMFALHPRCKMLRKGFLGKYRYRRLQISAERYTDEPEKNDYSHPHDALQYDASKLFTARLKGVEQEMKPLKIDTRYIV